MRNLFVIGLGVIASVAVTPTLHGEIFNAGQILQIDFSTTSPECPDGACNVLIIYPADDSSFFATDATANLYTGDTLLGTYFSAACCVPSFHSPSSLFVEGGTADFGAIDSAISNGLIDLSIGTGYLTWPGTPTLTLFLGYGTAAGVATGFDFQPSSVAIVTPAPAPEPSTFSIVLSGIVFLGFRQRRACLRKQSRIIPMGRSQRESSSQGRRVQS
jgi:hypothetical protein